MANQHTSWTKEQEAFLAAAISQPGVTWKDAAESLNQAYQSQYSATAVRQKGIRMGLRQTPAVEHTPEPESELWLVESQPGQRIKTLDDLLASAHVDLSIWDVERYVVNKWDNASKDANDEAQLVELYQVKVWLKRKHPLAVAMTELRDGLLKDIAALPKAHKEPAKYNAPHLREKVLFEFCPFDHHFARMSHNADLYDLETAGNTFIAAQQDLLHKAAGFNPGLALMVIGNDAGHFDNFTGTTTKGTPQDRCAHYIEMFRYARKIHSEAIHNLLDIGPVHIITVAGNHDRAFAFHLGEVLEAEFTGHKFVRFDNSAHPRKYRRHGINLLGFTHGCDEKHDALPLIMANEVPGLWAKTKHREWHLGHFHRMKETHYTAGDSFASVRVRILPSLAAIDNWHLTKGYIERRASEAYLWHAESGYIGHLSCNITDEYL
jgi:hypothetical protein